MSNHLSMDELILFMDRELPQEAAASAQQHLLACADCAQQLLRLKNGSNAYAQYREQVLEPALQVPTTGWARLSQERIKEKRHRWGLGWAVACACGLILAFAYWQMSKQPSAQEVLTRAEAAPEQATGSLLLSTGTDRLFRPAVLESGNTEARLQHVRALFVQANYSWERPLSARSFANWRRGLPQRDDSVTSISERGGRTLYRVETRTRSGILHAASLTLQAGTYHSTKADFLFQGEAPVELAEETEPPKNGLQEVQVAPPVLSKPAETPATPEDELRVFAALDAMGAEAEEPIDVRMDAEHHTVLVTGMGILASRRKEIETAMAGLPHTLVRFSAGQRLTDDVAAAHAAGGDAADDSQSFRQNLQDRYGGAHQLQAATDKALDASNSLFARTHLLLLLAREFPPGVESALSASGETALLGLRQRHVGGMEYALRQMKEELGPLLTPETSEPIVRGAHWQSGAEDLFAAARNLDRVVSRLLAGRYTEQEGTAMLAELPSDLGKVEMMIRAQSATDLH